MKVLAADTETRGLSWFDPAEQAFMVSWAWDGGSDVAWNEDAEAMARFRKAYDEADTIICHNAPFDCHQIRETYGIDMLTSGKTLIDTNELARVVLPERRFGEDAGYKLKDLAVTYVSRDAQDAEAAIEELAKSAGIKLKSTGGYWDTARAYPAEMETYAKRDTEITLALYELLKTKVNDSNRRVWELEHAVQPILIAAEARGVKIDQERVQPLKAQYEQQAEESHERVVSVLGPDALDGNDALKAALLEHGVPLHRRTPTGELATNKFALAEFEGKFPVVKDLSDWRAASKFLSTYIGPMDGRDVIHTNFHQQGAWTGRMSCSRPNMQNIPARAGSEVREMFVPREGHSFVVCDYDSIEVRLLAWYLNSPEYRGMIRDGLDPHAWLAANIWGGVPEDYHKGTPGEKKRSEAKNVLFAIVYGAGGPRVADMLGIPLPDAKALIRTVKTTVPKYMDLAGYNGRIRKKVEFSGHVTTLFGRRQPVKKDKSYVGLNALIQGSAADVFKQGVINVDELIKPLGATQLLFVHDEIVVECPTAYADECHGLIVKGMEAAYDLDPPLAVTGKVCHRSWAEAK